MLRVKEDDISEQTETDGTGVTDSTYYIQIFGLINAPNMFIYAKYLGMYGKLNMRL